MTAILLQILSYCEAFNTVWISTIYKP